MTMELQNNQTLRPVGKGNRVRCVARFVWSRSSGCAFTAVMAHKSLPSSRFSLKISASKDDLQKKAKNLFVVSYEEMPSLNQN